MKISKIKQVASEFLKDESGQSTTEYVLLLVFVVLAVKNVGKQLTTGLNQLVGTAFSTANQEAQSAGGGP